jgi:hypothetical protein
MKLHSKNVRVDSTRSALFSIFYFSEIFNMGFLYLRLSLLTCSLQLKFYLIFHNLNFCLYHTHACGNNTVAYVKRTHASGNHTRACVKSHSACENNTRAYRNHTHASGNHTRACEKHTLRAEITFVPVQITLERVFWSIERVSAKIYLKNDTHACEFHTQMCHFHKFACRIFSTSMRAVFCVLLYLIPCDSI